MVLMPSHTVNTVIDGQRAHTPHKSNSFTRLDSPRSSPLARSRASTLQNGPIAMHSELTASPLEENSRTFDQGDIFEQNSLVSGPKGIVHDVNELDSPQDVGCLLFFMPLFSTTTTSNS